MKQVLNLYERHLHSCVMESVAGAVYGCYALQFESLEVCSKRVCDEALNPIGTFRSELRGQCKTYASVLRAD